MSSHIVSLAITIYEWMVKTNVNIEQVAKIIGMVLYYIQCGQVPCILRLRELHSELLESAALKKLSNVSIKLNEDLETISVKVSDKDEFDEINIAVPSDGINKRIASEGGKPCILEFVLFKNQKIVNDYPSQFSSTDSLVAEIVRLAKVQEAKTKEGKCDELLERLASENFYHVHKRDDQICGYTKITFEKGPTREKSITIYIQGKYWIESIYVYDDNYAMISPKNQKHVLKGTNPTVVKHQCCNQEGDHRVEILNAESMVQIIRNMFPFSDEQRKQLDEVENCKLAEKRMRELNKKQVMEKYFMEYEGCNLFSGITCDLFETIPATSHEDSIKFEQQKTKMTTKQLRKLYVDYATEMLEVDPEEERMYREIIKDNTYLSFNKYAKSGKDVEKKIVDHFFNLVKTNSSNLQNGGKIRLTLRGLDCDGGKIFHQRKQEILSLLQTRINGTPSIADITVTRLADGVFAHSRHVKL